MCLHVCERARPLLKDSKHATRKGTKLDNSSSLAIRTLAALLSLQLVLSAIDGFYLNRNDTG